MNFTFSFPAIRGYQAGNEFFSIMCPLEVLSKLFVFYNNEIPEEFRAQRVLNENRIPEIRDYMLNNIDNYVFSSITASIDGDYNFFPSSEQNKDIGSLEISMSSNLLINDGQHRKAAIDEAIIENPNLKDETISVVLFIDDGLKKSQQMFSDLNRHAVNVSKSLSLLYNYRDPEALFTKKLMKDNKYLDSYIDKSQNSVSGNSSKVLTLNIFHESLKLTYSGHNIVNDNDIRKFCISYWTYLTNHFKEWTMIFSKEHSAKEARLQRISTHGVVVEAIGMLGNYLYNNHKSDWRKYVDKLDDIRWDRTDEQWLNRCVSNTGSIVKSKNYVKLTYFQIKILIGLDLNEEEVKFESNFERN